MSVTQVDLCVLGPVTLRSVDGTPVQPSSPRARALLVALALAGGRGVPVARLSEDLWSEEANPVDPRGSVQTIVSRMRRLAAPGSVELTPAGYRFAGTTDLDRAESALAAARRSLAHDPRSAVATVREALALWGGEPGTDVVGALGDALARRAAPLRDALGAVLLDALVAAEEWDDVLVLARERSGLDPLDEAATVALLRSCAATGAVTEGLRAYGVLSEALAETLGTSPSRAAREQHEALLRLDAAAGQASETGAGGTAHGSRGTHLGLRRAATTLVGREGAVEDVRARLESGRLVTVLGPGGLGKTRLAHEVGWRLLEDGAPLVVVVELVSVGTDADVLPALTAALGIHESSSGVRLGDRGTPTDVPRLVRERLAAPGTVVVLDNCEHVLDGAARAVADLMATTGVRVLATSRAPLEVDGEHGYVLEPLASGTEADGPAVELFVQRARAVRADVVVDPAAVARLCARLDGLPLAIELAAARTRSMTLEEIDEGLVRRFSLLTGGSRGAPARHRTLRAVIEWSWDMLAADERAVLRRASSFPAGFDLGAVETVAQELDGTCAGTREAVAALVSQSLLVMTEEPRTRTSRFRMLETVREFAAIELEAAGEAAVVRRAVVGWARDLAEATVSAMLGQGQRAAVLRLVREQDNLVQAFRWAVEDDDVTGAVAVCGALGVLALVGGTFVEMVGLTRDVAQVAHRASLDRPHGAVLTGLVLIALVGLAATRRVPVLLGRLAALARRPEIVGPGWVEALDVMLGAVRSPDQDALSRRARGSTVPVVALMGHLGGCAVAENHGDLEEATVIGERAHRIAVAQGNLWGRTTAAQLLAQVANERGDHGAAARWFHEAHENLIDLGAVSDIRQVELFEAGNDLAEGEVDRAAEIYRAAVTIPDPAPVLGEDDPLAQIASGAAHLRAAGFAGLGEIAWLQGDAVQALEQYDRCLAEVTPRDESGGRPWFLVHAAARLCVASLDAVQHDPAARPRDRRLAWARRLRVLMVARQRLSPEQTDAPVLGAAVLSLGAWLWTDAAGPSGPAPRVDDGLELLALAHRLGSRQDVPSLRRATHVAAAQARWGADRVAEASGRAQELTDRAAVLARVRALLSTPLS